MLDDLTVNNAMNIDHLDFNRLVGRGYLLSVRALPKAYTIKTILCFGYKMILHSI